MRRLWHGIPSTGLTDSPTREGESPGTAPSRQKLLEKCFQPCHVRRAGGRAQAKGAGSRVEKGCTTSWHGLIMHAFQHTFRSPGKGQSKVPTYRRIHVK